VKIKGPIAGSELSHVQPKSLEAVLKAIMRPEQFARLMEHCDLYGTSLESHVFDGMRDHVEVSLLAREQADGGAIDQAAKRTKKRRKESDYLTILERDLRALVLLS
jgi:hypothetical protein